MRVNGICYLLIILFLSISINDYLHSIYFIFNVHQIKLITYINENKHENILNLLCILNCTN